MFEQASQYKCIYKLHTSTTAIFSSRRLKYQLEQSLGCVHPSFGDCCSGDHWTVTTDSANCFHRSEFTLLWFLRLVNHWLTQLSYLHYFQEKILQGTQLEERQRRVPRQAAVLSDW